MSDERRRDTRVPASGIAPELRSVTLLKGSHEVAVTTIDAGQHGMGVLVPKASPVQFFVGDQVKVAVAGSRLDAEVLNVFPSFDIRHTRVGLYFSHERQLIPYHAVLKLASLSVTGLIL